MGPSLTPHIPQGKRILQQHGGIAKKTHERVVPLKQTKNATLARGAYELSRLLLYLEKGDLLLLLLCGCQRLLLAFFSIASNPQLVKIISPISHQLVPISRVFRAYRAFESRAVRSVVSSAKL
jgi:hypothetical protein